MKIVYFLHSILGSVVSHMSDPQVVTSTIISVILMAGILSAYEFVVYRAVLRKSLYNKAFNLTIAMLPFFVSTIILCLQADIVVTLGTIGALAIIRFRSAIKDPVDMIFLLWSIHIGITCGCQLYAVAILTSLAATAALFLLNYFSREKGSQILVVQMDKPDEALLMEVLKPYSGKIHIKSRNHTKKGSNYVAELSVKNPAALTKVLSDEITIQRFSLMEYDSDDII